MTQACTTAFTTEAEAHEAYVSTIRPCASPEVSQCVTPDPPVAYWWPNVPNYVVFNSTGQANLTLIQEVVDNAFFASELGAYMGDIDDVIDAVSIPVALVQTAVASMQQVEEVVAEVEAQEEAEKKAMIMAFISALFCFIPFVGEAAEAITGIATLARLCAIIGEARNIALSTYDVVENPSDPVAAILGALLGGLSVGGISNDLAALKRAASLRRDLSSVNVGKLGDDAVQSLTQIGKMTKRCR